MIVSMGFKWCLPGFIGWALCAAIFANSFAHRLKDGSIFPSFLKDKWVGHLQRNPTAVINNK